MRNKAFGCLYGAFAGDAIGAVAEFRDLSRVQHDIDKIMDMPGGGLMKVMPGQVTDDSEMAMSMIYAFMEMKGKFEADLIAHKYISWYNSHPFDIGMTTRNALSYPGPPSAAALHSRSSTMNNQSQSNGCLMRATPLAVYAAYHELSEKQIRNIVEADTRLTHSNIISIQSTQLYVLTITDLLRGMSVEQALKIHKIRAQKSIVKDWQNQVESGKKMIVTEKIGWSKIAWTYTYHWLLDYSKKSQLQGYSPATEYQTAIRGMVYQGGDSDTNACILGGMIGAVLGVQNIPSMYINRMLECKTERVLYTKQPLHPKVIEQFIFFLQKEGIQKMQKS